MSKVVFENEYFKSEKTSDGSIIVTVLKDKQKFYGINMEGCRLITNSQGFIADEFTDSVLEAIKSIRSTSEEVYLLKCELRNRTLNTLMQYI